MTTRQDRERLSVLGAGLFTNGLWDMLSVVVPLYAVAVGLNAAQIGLIVSARSVLPAMLSIHGGILMDELGTRRILLWVAAASAVLPLLFPVSGWFTVLLVLQLLLGLASGLGMAASQTWSMQTSGGMTSLLARYSIATRIGTFIGPVIVGAAWDLFGAWVAFACVAVCGAGTIAATAYCDPVGADPRNAKPSAAVLVPRWAPHRQALLLALIPGVAFVLAASFLRNAPGAIQSSLYVVYLNGIGVSGTLIGLLVAVAELSGVLGSLVAAPMERRLGRNRLVIACIAVSVAAIASTPLIGSFLAMLFLACAVRGIAQGMSQPLVYSILSVEVPDNRHGASVGLRNAVVRLASIITPAVMGMLAEAWGIEASFYVVGAAFLAGTALLAVAARRIA
ncbi:MAG: MFS transporter [Betaproteobacteria bacterium]|nr:MAG: MFS transporter [Betaproteobacteria bacterium]